MYAVAAGAGPEEKAYHPAVATPPAPCFVMCSDTGSQMFTSGLHLLMSGWRSVWFPDSNHQEHNDLLGASGFAAGVEHRRKVLFLSKFNYGPFGGGRWAAVQQEAFSLVEPKLADPRAIESRFWQQYYERICGDLGLSLIHI